MTFQILAAGFAAMTIIESVRAVRMVAREQASLAVESAGTAALFGAVALIAFVMGR